LVNCFVTVNLHNVGITGVYKGCGKCFLSYHILLSRSWMKASHFQWKNLWTQKHRSAYFSRKICI
ncbi:hypothetical protein PENTCL1PPCAC_13696, partial [Pristionchus entomophagus]